MLFEMGDIPEREFDRLKQDEELFTDKHQRYF